MRPSGLNARKSFRSLRQVVADAFDLVGVAGHRVPWQSDGVLAGLVLESRDDAQVEVEHGLPGGHAAAVHKVDTIRPEPDLGPSGDLLREMDARCQVFGGDVQQVGRVRTGDYEGVASGHRVDVHEGDCPLALSDRF